VRSELVRNVPGHTELTFTSSVKRENCSTSSAWLWGRRVASTCISLYGGCYVHVAVDDVDDLDVSERTGLGIVLALTPTLDIYILVRLSTFVDSNIWSFAPKLIHAHVNVYMYSKFLLHPS
jgi:hypothetical protein